MASASRVRVVELAVTIETPVITISADLGTNTCGVHNIVDSHATVATFASDLAPTGPMEMGSTSAVASPRTGLSPVGVSMLHHEDEEDAESVAAKALLADAAVRADQQGLCRDTMLNLKEAFEATLNAQRSLEVKQKIEQQRMAGLREEHCALQESLHETQAKLAAEEQAISGLLVKYHALEEELKAAYEGSEANKSELARKAEVKLKEARRMTMIETKAKGRALEQLERERANAQTMSDTLQATQVVHDEEKQHLRKCLLDQEAVSASLREKLAKTEKDSIALLKQLQTELMETGAAGKAEVKRMHSQVMEMAANDDIDAAAKKEREDEAAAAAKRQQEKEEAAAAAKRQQEKDEAQEEMAAALQKIALAEGECAKVYQQMEADRLQFEADLKAARNKTNEANSSQIAKAIIKLEAEQAAKDKLMQERAAALEQAALAQQEQVRIQLENRSRLAQQEQAALAQAIAMERAQAELEREQGKAERKRRQSEADLSPAKRSSSKRELEDQATVAAEVHKDINRLHSTHASEVQSMKNAQEALENEKRLLQGNIRDMNSALQQALGQAKNMEAALRKAKANGSLMMQERLAEMIADLEDAKGKLSRVTKQRNVLQDSNAWLHGRLDRTTRQGELERQFLPFIRVARGPLGQQNTMSKTFNKADTHTMSKTFNLSASDGKLNMMR